MCIRDSLYTPYLVEEITDQDGNVVSKHDSTPIRQVVSEETSALVRDIMEYEVTSGTGKNGQVAGYRIGGKTGTAQTGQYNAEGEELLNYWFSGFYPAEAPRYTITILQDGILKPETSSAALFARVTEILRVWEGG